MSKINDSRQQDFQEFRSCPVDVRLNPQVRCSHGAKVCTLCLVIAQACNPINSSSDIIPPDGLINQAASFTSNGRIVSL